MDMRGTHIFTSTVDPHFMQNPTQTRRNVHLTLHNTAKRYKTPFSQFQKNVHTVYPIGFTQFTQFTQTYVHTVYPKGTGFPPSLLPPRCPAARCLQDRAYARPLAAVTSWGDSGAVPSYIHRLGFAQDDSCPNCGQGPADTEHFFLHCPHTHNTESCTTYIHWSTSGPSQSKGVTSCLTLA